MGKNRKGFDEVIAQSAETRHDITDIAFEKVVDRASDQRISCIVERPLVLGEIRRGKSVADDHIRIVIKHKVCHLPRRFHRVGVVSVDENVALGIDLAEHAAEHIALALLILVPHNGAGLRGDFACSVGGVVVIDIHDRLRKRRMCILHDLAHRECLIVTGNQNCYLIHTIPHAAFFAASAGEMPEWAFSRIGTLVPKAPMSV